MEYRPWVTENENKITEANKNRDKTKGRHSNSHVIPGNFEAKSGKNTKTCCLVRIHGDQHMLKHSLTDYTILVRGR